jgi:hypothetical protein
MEGVLKEVLRQPAIANHLHKEAPDATLASREQFLSGDRRRFIGGGLPCAPAILLLWDGQRLASASVHMSNSAAGGKT